MWNNDFDPFDEIIKLNHATQQLHENQNQIAFAVNLQADSVKSLLHENKELTQALRQARQDIANLRADIHYLKTQQNSQ